MSKPICDVDFLQGYQLTWTVFFHEEDRANMFNNIEECFLFKDDLDYELEEFESKIDSMLEIESELVTLEEFTPNTQVVETQTSLCLPMAQQPSILSNQNERSTCVFFGFQDKVTFQIFKDPYIDVLQSPRKMNFLVFMDNDHMFSGHLQWPRFCFFRLLEETTRKIQVGSHLLNWLH